MELETRAVELIKNNEYPNVATVTADGRPWNTPVYAVADDNLKFYWSSWKEAEHSKNIVNNSGAFLTLYDSTRKRGDNNRRCLYLECKATVVEDQDEVSKAIELLYGDEEEKSEITDFLGEGLRRIYSATPNAMWLNDKSERQVTKETIKMRIEVSLDNVKKLIKKA